MAQLPQPSRPPAPEQRGLRRRNYYLESFTEEERIFLSKKLTKERSQFRRILRNLTILTAAAPLFVAIVLFGISAMDPVLEEEDHVQVLTTVVIKVNVLVVFCIFASVSLIVILGFYWEYIRKLVRDIRQGEKVVEQAIIDRKQFVPHNQSFYFHLRIKHKPLLEVDEIFFRNWQEGDEINLEYAPRTGIQFGYF